MYHPDKPIYKGYFTCSPSTKMDQITKIFIAFGPELTHDRWRNLQTEQQGAKKYSRSDGLRCIRIVDNYQRKEICRSIWWFIP